MESPVWLAVTVTVPVVPERVRVVPVRLAGPETENTTGRPEVAVAARLKAGAPTWTLAGAVKAMVCCAFPMVKDREAEADA